MTMRIKHRSLLLICTMASFSSLAFAARCEIDLNLPKKPVQSASWFLTYRDQKVEENLRPISEKALEKKGYRITEGARYIFESDFKVDERFKNEIQCESEIRILDSKVHRYILKESTPIWTEKTIFGRAKLKVFKKLPSMVSAACIRSLKRSLKNSPFVIQIANDPSPLEFQI